LENTSSGKISLKAIEAFVATVEEQSVSLAAKRLGASVSAVSLQLGNLETALDCRLVERSAQRFVVTQAGETFLKRALQILDEIEGAKADLINTAHTPPMKLRMAVIEDFDRHVIPKWLASIGGSLPNTRFIVRSGPSHENFSSLTGRAVDLIVATAAMDPADWIEEHRLIRDPFVVVTAGRNGVSSGTAELMDRPFVRYARELHIGRQIEAQLRRTGMVPAMGHEFSSNQAVFSMVDATGGWAITTAAAVHGTLFATAVDRGASLQNLSFQRLPFAAFARHISLYARKGVLNRVPALVATAMRERLAEIFDAPGLRDLLPVQPDVEPDD